MAEGFTQQPNQRNQRNQGEQSPIDLLTDDELFGPLEESLRAALGRELETIQLREGETLFNQGDPGDSMYVVASGLLEARVHDANGRATAVDRIDAGRSVGEMALLTGQPRSADIVALVDSELIRLPKAGYERLAAAHPDVVARFARSMTPRLRRVQLVGILTQLFGEMDATTLHEFQEQLTWRHLANGEVLFEQGESGHTMYIVVNGRLQITFRERDGRERSLGEVGPGETVGEFALLTDEPRSAQVRAIRESNVVELTRPMFERLMPRFPQAMLEITRIIIRRRQLALRVTSHAEAPLALSLAILPTGGVSAESFAHRLAGYLQGYGLTRVWTADSFDEAFGRPGAAQMTADDPIYPVLTGWMTEQERHYRHLLYVADGSADGSWSAWTQRCLDQADRLLLVARPDDNPQPGAGEAALPGQTRRDLVLFHPAGTVLPRGTAAWLQPRQITAHYHVTEDHPAQWQRLARRLTGRSVGLVLSGGAARGMAHIGVIHALEEMGLPVDYVGGTSIGALIGGAWVMRNDYEGLTQLAERFANPRELFDYTLPFTSVMASHKLTRVLQDIFGETLIEEMWRPFFAVATNLSTAEPVIQDRGQLWQAIRASSALPPVFSPLLNEERQVLVDGGVMNNFPVEIMVGRTEGGPVVGVNVNPHRERPGKYDFGDSISGWQVLRGRILPFGKKLRVPSLVGSMMRTMEINTVYHNKETQKLAALLIEPDVKQFGILDFGAYRALIDIGYTAAREALAGWHHD